MTPRAVVRLVVLTAVVLVVQWTFGLDIRIAGAHPDFMILLPIAAGIAGGPTEGAVAGFLAGMAVDLLLPTPFGLSALVWCLVGFGIGTSSGGGTWQAWWASPVLAFVASAGAVLGYAVLGALLGQPQFLHLDLVPVVLDVAVANAALAVPATALVRRAVDAPEASHRASVAPARRW